MTDETDGAHVPPEAIVPDADGTLLAIRRLGTDLVADPGFQRRFPAEVSALNGLDEPWLAAPTSYLLDNAGRVVASLRRHVPGPRLAAFLEHHPRGLDAQTTTLIALDVLTALSALHARGVGHRAVSAGNVVIDTDGVCVLVDVGLTPRTGPDALDLTIATDLAWFADLVALCLAGRPLGRRRRQAPLLMGAWLPKTVPEPVRSLLRRALDPARGAAGAAVAAAMLTDLSLAAVSQFDADWDVRARERLLSASRAAAANDTPVPAPVRAPASHRRKLTRHREVRRTHRASVAFAILGIGAAVGICAALAGGSGSAPRITQIMMYETPSSAPSPHGPPAAPAAPTASATSAAPTKSASAPTTSPSTTPTTPSVSPQPSSPSTSRAPEATTVTTLTIVKFTYVDAVPAEAVVVIRVHVSNTHRITLSLTFAGSNESGVAGASSPTTVSYTLEGKRSYLVAYRIYGFAYCYADFWGVTAETSPQAPAAQYAQLPSILCWGPDIKPSGDD